MAKKDKKSNKDEDSSKKDDSEKKKIEFDLSDGISWHDFAGIFVLIGRFIWKIIRLVLAPVFWIWGENVRMVRFMRATDHERVLNEDERWFMETIPFIYTLTGLIGGILLGIFAAFSFSEAIQDFLRALSIDFLDSFFGLIGDILLGIWTVIVWIVTGIAKIVSFFVDVFLAAFKVNPFLALGGLLLLGVVFMLIFITITETGFLNRVTEAFKQAFYWLVGSPERFRLRVNSFYRKFNHKLTVLLIGRERVHTRTQIYFKKVVLYTFILSLWSFISGIFIGVNPEDYGGLDTTFEKVLFTSVVLFLAGVISGTLFFSFVARVLDLYSRKKYIAPQFIKGDTVDSEAIKEHTKKDEERIAKVLEVPKEVTKSKEKKETETKEKDTS